ncbi:MAG: hypothetical protein JWP97_4646 [Labilithrix sp.]|nr:hypothetical protein [Labilithrix sp.]
MIEWDDLRIFLAIHRKGQLTAAARTLGADQSTVGRRLSALESKLGAKLFFRTRDGLTPTVVAERLVPRAERMEEEAFAISRENAGEEERIRGLVRLTAPDGFSAKVLAPIAARFAKQNPEVDVEMLAGNRIFSLAKQEADLAFRVGSRPREAGLVVRKVAEYGLGLYAARSYVEQRGMPKPDYAGHDVVAFDASSRVFSDVRWLNEHARGARVAFRASNDWVATAAMREGLGFGLLPTFIARDEDFVEVRAPGDTLTMTVWLALHKDLRHTARVRACADFVAAALTAQAAELAGARRRKPAGAREMVR